MILKLIPIVNQNIYKNLISFSNDNLIVDDEKKWEDYLFQNKQRKDNKKDENNLNFMKKRIKKNIKGFENGIESFGFNKELNSGYFLDYSSYVNIFLFFSSEDEIINYVQDTCEARGELNSKNFRPIKTFNDAIAYLKNEDVVISKVENIMIDENQWNQFKAKYETEKK